jgi:anti-sigma regulatory factor (Ser/Thr protein kinase)/GNAT superfamily N-acetyltransferase
MSMSLEQTFDPQRCSLTVPNDLAYLPMVQAFVRAYAAETGFPAREVGRFDLLMEEAATNVIQGAFGEDERATFDIHCERVPMGMQITVHDEGMPFDPSLIPEYDPGAGLHAQTGRGLGSFLMQKMADTVEFHNLGSRGKETVFIKYLESHAVTDAPPAEEEPIEETCEHVPPAERIEIGVGPLVADQAIEVCRCIYDAYRYTYVNEHLYYPDRVVALNQSGDMISAVAATCDGEVAGHAALVFPEDTHEVADLAVVATKARFRGQSIARRLGEYLDDEARQRGLHGMFIEEVTVHTYTQKFCHRLGFADTGFLLAYSPATTRFEGIAGTADARRSVVVGFKYLDPPAPAVVYAPRRHRDALAGIYRRLGAPVTFGRDVKASSRGLPELNVSVNTRRSVATIRIPSYGRDLHERIRAEVVRLLRENVSVIDVFLDLSQRGTGRVAENLEEAGFILSGVLPGGPSGDWLIMQFFNGVMVDYDAIQIEDPATAELLAYIRAGDPRAG